MNSHLGEPGRAISGPPGIDGHPGPSGLPGAKGNSNESSKYFNNDTCNL